MNERIGGEQDGMLRVVLANEALKTARRPAFWVLIGVFAGCIAFVAVVSELLARADGVRLVSRSWTVVPAGAAAVGPICAGLALALLFVPEFKWRTARQNVIDGVSKDSFFAGKLLLVPALIVAFLALAWALGAAAALIFPPPDGLQAPALADLQAWTGLALAMGVWAGAAFLLAAVLRAGGATVGVLLGYFVVEGVAASLGKATAAMRGLEFLFTALDYLPGRVSEALGGYRLHYGSTAPVEWNGVVFGEPPGFWPLAGIACAYVAAFVALAYANFRRRDL